MNTTKPNLILPVSPMFASIMTPVAAKLVKKLAKVKSIKSSETSHVECVREVSWADGSDNQNLERASIPIGTQGLVVEALGTVLRVLVSEGDSLDTTFHHIYHLGVLNLELVVMEPQLGVQEDKEV